MAPVRLRKVEHQTLLAGELDAEVRGYMAAEGGRDVPEGQEDAIVAQLQKVAESIEKHVHRNVVISEDAKETRQSQRGKRKSKQTLKETAAHSELSPKKGSVEDVLLLEKEVQALAAKIEAHRQNVPKLLAQQLAEHLQQIRPLATPAEAPETDATVLDPSDESCLEPIVGLPSLEELQQKVAGAAAELPGLRKRLEAAEAKMDRVVTAVEQEMAKGGPSLPEQVIAEHDEVSGYVGGQPQAKGTKRPAILADLGQSPRTRSRARA